MEGKEVEFPILLIQIRLILRIHQRQLIHLARLILTAMINIQAMSLLIHHRTQEPKVIQTTAPSLLKHTIEANIALEDLGHHQLQQILQITEAEEGLTLPIHHRQTNRPINGENCIIGDIPDRKEISKNQGNVGHGNRTDRKNRFERRGK